MIMTFKKLVVSTIVKDEEKLIGDCLISVQKQSYPFLVHVVVDDYSEDQTVSMIRKLNLENVEILSSKYPKLPRQHGFHQLRLRQQAIEECTLLIPDWDYLLNLDADCVLPKNYCSQLIQELESNPNLAITGAKHLRTPTTVETSFKLRGCNHIVKRSFFDHCLKAGKNYANILGERLLEHHGWIYGWETKTFPLMVKQGRETGQGWVNGFMKGVYDFQLGDPWFVSLVNLRRFSRENFMRLLGWIVAKVRGEKQYFSKSEVKRLRKFFIDYYIKKIR